jgi:predicted Zn-ribbon and HTH transcriptional regulator
MSIRRVTRTEEVNECTCNRCGAVFDSKIVPVRCRSCRSPDWNAPRIYKKKPKSNVKDQKAR